MDREFIKIERTQSGWQMLFQKLYQIARANAGSQSIAKKPMNVIRNRYRDVLPIDSTRVVLDDPDSDYINANFVKVEEVGRSYILCQGPLQHTTPHLWQMVWEQNTVGVIMLNKCIERGMNKCYPYWPQPSDPPMDLGKFVVENIGYDDGLSYRLTRLKLVKVETDESREIQHFHYTRWPDFGVPQNPEVFLDFLYAVRAAGVLESDKGPAVVHCSAGIGRSGTFCIVDALLAKLEQTRDIASVDLQGTLLDMRRQRLGLIQTADQLRFSYIAVLQGALQDMELDASNYDDLVGEEEREPDDEEEDEDEVETDDSDDDEEEEDTEARLERKYPNLTRQTSSPKIPVVDADEVPPPLPPRPIETLRPRFDEGLESSEEEGDSEEVASDESPLPSPPTTPPPPSSTPPPPSSTPPPPSSTPPPPTSPPPGTSEPVTSNSPAKKIRLESQDPSFLDPDSDEDEFGFVVSSHPPASSNSEETINKKAGTVVVENGELEESGSEEDSSLLDPPPIPPRNHSLSPGPTTSYLHDYMNDDTGMADIYGTDPSSLWARESTGGSHSFLLEGRGGERAYPPLPRMTNGIAANADVNEDPPPPIPAKQERRKSGTRLEEITEEERALVGELDFLAKMMESKPDKKLSTEIPAVVSSDEEGEKVEDELSSKGAERMRLREEKRARLIDKVQTVKDGMKKNEDGFESDWSIPWLLVGFVVMLGYCAYYIIQ